MTEILNFILILNVFSGATSYTVTVRRVQNQSPSYYRFSPEVIVTGIHRVTTPMPQIQERLHIVRIPKYRRKNRYRMKNNKPMIYPMIVTHRSRPSSSKNYHEPRPLPTIVSNDVEESNAEYQKEIDFSNLNIDDGISFPSFGKDGSYQDIRKPKEWSSTPIPIKDSESSFTPVQMYLQIRQTNKVKHVPQSEAIKDATTLEEVVNAPRLKELLRTTRVREIYSEEGYEDAGYDHGGHIRHAEHDEGYTAKDEGIFKLKESVKEEDYTLPEENRSKSTLLSSNEKISQDIKKKRLEKEEDEEVQESKLEPKISQSRSEVTSVEIATLPSKYKGEHKYSSKIRSMIRDDNNERKLTTESNFSTKPNLFDGLSNPTSSIGYDLFTLPSNKKTNEITTQRSKYIKIIANSEEPIINQNSSNIERFKKNGFKYNRLYANYPKRDRFRLKKLNQAIPTMETIETNSEAEDKRIILPTIGYINSLTTAHFGKNKTNQINNNNNNNLLTTPLNLTQALNYLRLNKKYPIKKIYTKVINDDNVNFEAKKLKIRNKRELEDEEDDGEKIHNEKNMEIDEEERQRIKNDEMEYEKKLREELDKEEKEIIKATIERYQSIDDDHILESMNETFKESNNDNLNDEMFIITTIKPINIKKYPFYYSQNVNIDSPIRYAINPINFPKKTRRGMVFYESREKLIQCPEVRPDLSDIPKKNTTLETEEINHSRLIGLGDKIACLRAKYFDEDPLDNPLFKEKEIDYIGKIKYRKKKNITHENLRNGRDNYQPMKNKLKNSIQTDESKNLRYHSSYQYQPNSTLHIMLQERRKNLTGIDRIIPVTENVDEIPIQSATNNKITIFTPPQLHRKLIHPHYQPFITSTPSTPNNPIQNKLIIPHNCIHVISKMATLNGNKNLIIECNDGILIQKFQNDIHYLKIIPKISEIKKINVPFESTDWIPMTSYPKLSRFGRNKNDSDHYLIMELNEEKDIRRGERIEKNVQSNKKENQKNRRRRSVEVDKRKFANGPLRLSLKEFFLLLQNGNERNRFLPKPFQLPSTTSKPEESLEDEEVVKIGGQYIKGTNGRELVYIRLYPSSAGRWIIREASPETGKYTKKTFKDIYKKYGKGKL